MTIVQGSYTDKISSKQYYSTDVIVGTSVIRKCVASNNEK